MMPGINGLDLLDKVREADPTIIPIVITGYPTIDSAVEAMRRGAYDFLPKPFSPEELRIIVQRGYERRALMLETARLREEKQQLQDYFITLVSHEIRSPLATVQQNFNAILGGYVGDIPPRQQELLERCSERIEGVMKLVEDWLSKKRIDMGQSSGANRPVDMVRLLQKVCRELGSSAEENGVELHSRVPTDCPAIIGNESSLEVVFTNLISNGIKYNQTGGTVEVSLNWSDDQLQVEVTDTGVGIPQDKLPLIFEEFYRIPMNFSQPRPAGSGLGLAIAKRIIEAHDGTISVESEEDQGTTFTITLPLFLG
jgi:two-component system sensor histidine kinase/response regulator